MYDPSEYKSPKWQKKRLEVCEAAEWKCQCCWEETKQLHIHHLRYSNGKKIWEYPCNALRCVCEDCHKNFHHATDMFRELLGHIDKPGLGRLMVTIRHLSDLTPPMANNVLAMFMATSSWACDSECYEGTSEYAEAHPEAKG